MHEIRKNHHDRSSHIPKEIQSGMTQHGIFESYMRNCAVTSGYKFIVQGGGLSRALQAYEKHLGRDKFSKQDIVVNEIMSNDESFKSFKIWFHKEYMKQCESV